MKQSNKKNQNKETFWGEREGESENESEMTPPPPPPPLSLIRCQTDQYEYIGGDMGAI